MMKCPMNQDFKTKSVRERDSTQHCCTQLWITQRTRDLRIVFFVRMNLESNRPSDSFSNRIFESNQAYIPRKPYHGLTVRRRTVQAYNMLTTSIVNEREW